MIVHIFSCVNNKEIFNVVKSYIKSLLPKDKQFHFINFRTMTLEEADNIRKNKYDKFIVFGRSKKKITFNYRKQIFLNFSEKELLQYNEKDREEVSPEKQKDISFKKCKVKYEKMLSKFKHKKYTVMNLKEIGEYMKENL
jgi:hypothetical protein